MSISLTRILQQITGLNTFFAGPSASRDNGVVLQDTASVTWGTDGQGNIQATASAIGLPTATAAGQVPTATGAGTTYTAQTPALVLIQEQALASAANSVTFALPSGYKYYKLLINAPNTGNAAVQYYGNVNGDVTATDYFASFMQQSYGSSFVSNGGFTSPGLTFPTNASESTLYPTTGGGLTAVGIGNNQQGTIALNITASQWIAAVAATSLVLTPNAGQFLAGSTFTLLGIQ